MVPDIKPDILNSICCNGTICIYKKEIANGKVRLDGCINAYIMYLADDENGGVRSLNTTLEFSQTIDFDAAKEGMILEDNAILKSIECRVLNGRKVNIKAIVDFELKILSNDEIEFIQGVEDVKDIQVLDKTLNLNSLLGTGITKVYAKDTIVIDSMDNLSEIMKVDIKVINKETKISYNKVLVKADACVKIMYLTDDNRICTTTNLIPIMGFIDMVDVNDDNICDVNYQIKNIIIKPNNIEEHSIYVEVEIEVNCNVYQTREMNIIEDLYSPSIDLIYKQKLIHTMANKQIIKNTYSIREKQYIPEIGNNKIFDVDIMPNIINQKALNDRIVYEGEVNINFLFSADSSSKIDIKSIVVPFNFNMDYTGIMPTSQIENQIDIVLQDFTVMSDGSIDIKIDLEFCTKSVNNQEIQVIEEIDIDESRDKQRCSLVIYFVKPGDTLWNIAKKFRSTINNIVEMNNIQDENKINVGQQLFIPSAM